MLSRATARQLVEDIGRSHGYIRQEVLDRMPEADRREVQAAMLMKDQLIASSVTTLARNLYTSNARFVFELLQNADDNHYATARANSEPPYVSFRVHPDRVIMECNEDGFTSENLTAICNVGKSSKTGAQGYIGEKGIGFKSVFMAAYKVHIQSGAFSFYFQHHHDDPGMGMITPVWQDVADGLGGRFTRITLYLHNDGDADTIAERRQTMREQFQDIHETILLFMRNLQKINIAFHDDDDDDRATRTISFSMDYPTSNRARVTKSTSQHGKRDEDVRHYHMTKYVATNLAKNENRTYSESEEASRAYSTGEVVLAFPLSAESVPVIENQWVFAFLPVRQMGFKFLVQADFVTQANRQDIVTTSVRNQRLVDGIAEAFITAVQQLCEHDTLQYQWMRYLPKQEDYPWDGFWTSLIDKIGTRLRSTPVLKPANGGALRLIEHIKRHSKFKNNLDRDGKPLFRDIEPGIYLSLRYQRQDLDILAQHGLNVMSMQQVIERVKHDIASPDSRLKSVKDQDWQSRAARLLQLPWGENATNRQDDVKQLRMLPLQNSRWVSASSGAVYYHQAGSTSLDIPVDLGLDVVDPAVIANADRKKLFDLVGVQSASVPFIRDRILQKYQKGTPIFPLMAAHHLRFLYLTQHLVQAPYRYEELRIFSQHGKLENSEKVDFYIQDDEPYGASKILQPTPSGSGPGAGAPGFDVLFINGAYFEDIPSPPSRDSLSWKEWLYRFFHIRRHLRLIDVNEWQGSHICSYVAAHRPEKFLGLLQAVWKSEKKGVPPEKMKTILEKFACIKVLCEGDKTYDLQDTYFPTAELKTICGRFLLDGELFPWLQLETRTIHDRFPGGWNALGEAFGLGFKGPDVDFFVHILRSIKRANTLAGSIAAPERVCELYKCIHGKVQESSDPDECMESIQHHIMSCDFIYVPEDSTHEAKWTNPEECVWDGPTELTLKYPLKLLYASKFQQFERDRPYLAGFFSNTLNIPNCDWTHIVQEIEEFKTSGCTDFDRINKLYKFLAEMCPEDDGDKLKEMFENNGLICGFVNGSASWHKPSQCLWSTATRINRMLILNDLYGDQKAFFVERLGVQTMTAEMVYGKLKALHIPALSIDEAKETILTFSSMMKGEDGSFDPAPVLEREIFPVRLPGGRVTLRRGSSAFALLDRQLLGDDFADKAIFLDFSMSQIRDLKPFIKWARLEGRYLSKAVKEISSADAGSTRPVSSEDRCIKRKAHALLRVVAFHQIARARGSLQELYNVLRNAETLETDQITSELLLSQGGKLLRVEKETATLHIDDGPHGLKVYVPKDPRSQEVCFNSKLARRLCEWMMTEPTTLITEPAGPEVLSAVQSVLTTKVFALADVLDEHGIGSTDIPEAEAEDLDEDNGFSEDLTPATSEDHTPAASEESHDEAPQPLHAVPTNQFTRPPPQTLTDGDSREVSYITAQSGHRASRHWAQPALASDSDDYPELIRQVVSAARQATFPTRGIFDMSGVGAALPENQAFGNHFRILSTSGIERDKMVGAAGELFVFEMLSRVTPGLPGFSRANWQSTIRRYVTCHPEYSDMAPWNGSETADIVYSDDGTLTRVFVDNGNLDAETWADARPRYFIEVKATTGPCETPFFMSKYQHARMQDCCGSNGDAPRPDSIYVVIRVFNLGKSSIDFKVLVDPEGMRQRGELAFTAENWSVVAQG